MSETKYLISKGCCGCCGTAEELPFDKYYTKEEIKVLLNSINSTGKSLTMAEIFDKMHRI